MIRIDFQEPCTAKWKRWRTDCKKACDELCAAANDGKDVDVKSIYRRRSIKKEVYMHKEGPFCGKCAYCECYITDFQHGDMEHFRPKKGVTDDEDNPIKRINGDGQDEEHPGYYWLAYEWQNLLPSCIACNQATEVDGKKIGKHNRFPVDGLHAFDADSLPAEQPMLINPVTEDPSDHLTVDPTTGLMLAKSERGEMCIQIFGLNIRDRLPENRAKAIDRVKVVLNDIIHNPARRAEAINEIAMIRSGKTEFAAAANAYLDEIGPTLKHLFE